MVMLKISVSGLKNLERTIKTADKENKKALTTAIKVEGYRLRKLMISEIRSGAPGGRRFAKLSYIRRLTGGRLRPDKPYGLKQTDTALRGGGAAMTAAIRYNIVKNDPFVMAIGWTGPKVSNSYKKLADALQKGFASPVTDRRRAWLAETGGALGPRRKIRKYFFLRKNTTFFKTPGRPVIEPFWRAQQEDAWKNIRNNFRRKMRGERI